LRCWIVGGVVSVVLVDCANAAGMTIAVKMAVPKMNLIAFMASSDECSVTFGALLDFTT